MATIAQLRIGLGIDGRDLFDGLRDGGRRIDRFVSDAEAKLKSLPAPKVEAPELPRPAAAAADLGADLVDGLGASMLPMAAQIQTGFQAAFAPVGKIVARVAAQFEAMAGSVIATNRRLDDDVRYDNFQKRVAQLRDAVRSRFEEMEEGPRRWAQRADKALGGMQWASKLRNQLGMLSGIDRRAAAEMGRIKAPTLDMGPTLAKLSGVAPMMGAVAKSTERAGQSFRAFGVQALAALGFVGVGYKAVGFLSDGIKGASDLNESINKTNVLLGAAAPAVTRFADTMAADFGFMKADTLGVATAIAGLGKGLGKLEGDQLGKFTTDLTQLAADVGSINNMEIKDVGAAFRIGLSGEQSDTLKQLGVVLTETTVKGYALAHGIGKVDSELTEQQKVMARAGIISEKLAFANGDLANTINDPANAYRKFTGSIRNLGVEVGSALMPAVRAAVGVANGVVGRLSTAFEAARPAIEAFGLAAAEGMRVAQAAVDYLLPTVTRFYGTILGAARGGASAFASWLPSVSSVVGAVKSFYATMTMGLENLIAGVRGFPAFFDAAFGPGPANLLGTLAGWLKGALVGGIEVAGFAIRNMGDLFHLALLKAGQGVAFVLDNVALIPENLGRVARFVGGNWLDLMLAPYRTLAKAIGRVAESIWDFFRNPAGGFHLDVDGILDEYKRLYAKLPDMAKAQALDISADVKARQDSIAAREADYQSRLGKPFEPPKADAAGPAKAAAAAAAGAAARVAADLSKARAAAPDVTEELAKYAKDLAEKLKSPLAKFEELMQKARDARAANLITADQFKKAEAANRKEAGLSDVKYSGAMDLGSREAYTTLVSALYNNRANDAQRTAQATLKATQDGNTILNKIATKIGEFVGNNIPVAKVS